MCYSALVEQSLKKYLRIQVRVDLALFEEIFVQRARGEKIGLTKALEKNFLLPESPIEEKIFAAIQMFRRDQREKLEKDLFAQKAKLAEAERKLQEKITKTAQKAKEVAERQIGRILERIERTSQTQESESDSRIFAFDYAPVIMGKNGEKVLTPMRYHLRPPGMPESFDRKYPGCYNARRDSLTGFWRQQFGKKHAVLLVSAFFENVKLHDYEKRKLRPGEAESNKILKFLPEGHEFMYVPCIWDEWKDADGKILRSFALITDEPPAEVAETGHDRCPIFLKKENLDRWLNPAGKTDAELMALLADKEQPYYRHAMAI
jgi:putative SOS response-associated peptidase YedK